MKSEVKQNVIKDDEYVYYKDEYDQVRKFIGMYISYRGTKAALHLFKEIFNNALDECVSKNSPADQIDIYFDESTLRIIIEDNGRGIPFEKLREVCTKKHTTTKEGRKFNVESAGENGVGLKVTAALSDYYQVTSYRGKEYKTLTVTKGKDIVESKPMKNKKEKTGLRVEFIPSEEYLGKIHLTADDICEWLRCMSYICPEGITMKLVSKRKKSDVILSRTYKSEGLAEDVRYLGNDLEFAPMTVGFDQISEEDPMREFAIQMSFSYDLTLDGETIDSYCNYVHTIENGTHVDGCESALCSFFVKTAQKLDPKSKYPVTFEDCKKGLILVVNCKAARPNFSGQVKERVGNEYMQTDSRKQMQKALDTYFVSNQATLKKIIDYLRKMAKIRLASHSMKGLDGKKTQTWADEREVPTYIGLSDRNTKGYTELFICEGDSAGRHVANMVDHRYQAVYLLRGVIPNAFGVSTEKAMKNDVLRNLVKILGCGIGKDFNISNLRFDKIIILSDEDIDGHNITSLLCAFFAIHLPQIIIEERLYKAVPPLYLLKDNKKNSFIKGNKYIFDKHQYNDIYDRAVADNVEITLLPDKGEPIPLSKKEAYGWMRTNLQYLYYLENMVKKSAAPLYIVEVVCWEYLASEGDSKKFKKLIEKVFPECKFDIAEHSLRGAYNKEDITLIVDNIFLKNAERLLEIMRENPSLIVQFKNRSNKESDPMKVTVGQFLSIVSSKYSPDIDQRFKGLGEMDGELLFVSTLNPAIRKLYKITMHSADRAIEQISNLHGKENADFRKNLVYQGRYTIEDIDN